jgi:hypothetical protein
MIAETDIAEPAHDAAPKGAAVDHDARRERHLKMLDRLTEIGMTLAESIQSEVLAGPLVGEFKGSHLSIRFHNDMALAFARTSRAVRQTVALYGDMTAPPSEPREPKAKAASEPAPVTLEDLLEDRERRLAATALRKQRLVDQVQAIARRAGCTAESLDRLTRESRERLDDRETWGDLSRRPFSEILDQICRDLGLTPDWAVLRYEPWAVEERRCGPVGSPLQNNAPPAAHHRPPIPEPAAASP